MRVEHAPRSRRASSARRSQNSSPRPGTTLNASPERSTVGTAVRRAGPSGSCARGDGLRGRGQREQRVAAAVGRRAASARCGRARSTWIVPAALRRTTTPSSPPARARRPRSTGTRRSRRSARRARTAPCATPRRRRAAARPRRRAPGAGRARAARRARARRRPSCRPLPEPTSCSPVALSGWCSACATTVSTWPSSSDPPRAGAVQAREQVGRVAGRRARRRARRRPRRAAAPRRPTRTPRRRARRRTGEETATSASSSRGARRAISAAASPRSTGPCAPAG